MRRHFVLHTALLLSIHSPILAALITSHTDTDPNGAVADGVISPDEYGIGNTFAYSGGGSGFSGGLGNATLHLQSDTGYLTLGLSDLGVHTNDDQYLFYFQTRAGGYQPSGGEMDDGVVINQGDAGRRNSSILSSSGVERVSFTDGSQSNAPDFALVINNRDPGSGGFVALFELQPAGQEHLYHDVPGAGLNTTTVEVDIPLRLLALEPGDPV